MRLIRTFFVALLACLPSATAARAQGVIEHYETDAIGSVRAVTDAAGTVIARHDYFPFGEEFAPPAPSGAPVRFVGKERDAETGLDYFGARYHSSRIGRFTTVDPVQTTAENLIDPQLWNRYAYVRNNPLRYTDPDGRCIEDLCIGELALALGVAHETAAVLEMVSVSAVILSPPGRSAINGTIDLLRGGAWNAIQAMSNARLGPGAYRPDSTLPPDPSLIFSKSDPGKGLRDQIAKHEQKLADYLSNPDARDNKGFLKDATPERRAKIIEARVRALEKQIRDFKEQLEKLASKKDPPPQP